MINKDFNPVEVWNKAMDKLAEKNRELVNENASIETVNEEPAIQHEIKLTPSEVSKKSAATLLARNPNYYKELSARAHAKKLEMKKRST